MKPNFLEQYLKCNFVSTNFIVLEFNDFFEKLSLIIHKAFSLYFSDPNGIKLRKHFSVLVIRVFLYQNYDLYGNGLNFIFKIDGLIYIICCYYYVFIFIYIFND